MDVVISCLKLSRRMGVSFKDEPRYKLTPQAQ